MRKHPNEREYWDCVSELLADGAVQAMRLLPQHRAGVSCFDHSMLVSRISWRICRALGLDERAAARGGGGPVSGCPGGGPLPYVGRWSRRRMRSAGRGEPDGDLRERDG